MSSAVRAQAARPGMIVALVARHATTSIMKRFLLIAVLCLPALAFADYESAVSAYAGGRYQEALTEFKRLAAEVLNDVEKRAA